MIYKNNNIKEIMTLENNDIKRKRLVKNNNLLKIIMHKK